MMKLNEKTGAEYSLLPEENGWTLDKDDFFCHHTSTMKEMVLFLREKLAQSHSVRRLNEA